MGRVASSAGSSSRWSPRAVAALAVVCVTPAAAWALWVAWAGDDVPALWFLTVAAGCMLAGRLATPRGVIFAALWAAAVIATEVTLALWWSHADATGLFVIGLALSVMPVVLAVPVLLAGGSWLSTRSRRRAAPTA